MGKLSEQFKTRRVEALPDRLEPQPSAFEVVGGWGPSSDDGTPDREAAREGARVAAELEARRLQRKRDAVGH